MNDMSVTAPTRCDGSRPCLTGESRGERGAVK
jgi:hypothetical protein